MTEKLYDDDNPERDDEIREAESGVGGSRWNPAKEQIEMLERIYNNEGVRTPTAEQIQQITARLRVYGHIEGKNVFYWFQNHKARQRQKQRQERLAAAAATTNLNNFHHNHTINHINRFIGHPTLPPLHHYHSTNPSVNGVNLHANHIFPATPTHHNYSQHNYLPNPNVICSSYYSLQQPNNNDVGFHPLHSPQFNYSAPTGDHHALMKRSSPSNKHLCNSVVQLPRGGGVPRGSTLTGYCAAMLKGDYDNHSCVGARTLDLFPVHPTGILEHKFDISVTNNSAANSSAHSSSSDTNIFGDEKHLMLFDFFSSGHESE